MAQNLTPADLVKRWGGAVASSTLANWRSLGTGPAYIKLGRLVFYPLDQVEIFERANTRLAPSNLDAKNG